ncbi:MAG: hypothetical protein IKU90_04330 [Clostridia bacterium]|nr:hypothetical protein [Clostridia bacterium]
MRKLTILLTAVAAVTLCLLFLMLPTAAKAEFEMEIPYGKPTVDGVIEEGEYSASYVMNKISATAWVGDVGGSKVTWYLAWDEGGLYYAGTINDSTPTWRDENTHWVGLDCLELAINPGLILSGEVTEGVFFSFGSMKDGTVVGYRHNFADGLVSGKITGANKGHTPRTKSYTMEVYIPWSLVQIDEYCTVGGKEDIHLDATAWKAEAGAQLGLLPCAIDSLTADGSDIIAYKFNGTDFMVEDFVVATLLAPTAEDMTEEADDTADETTADATEEATSGGLSIEVLTDPVTEVTTAPAESADDSSVEASTVTPAETDAATDVPSEKSGCGSTVAVAILALIPAAWVTLRKREE